MNLADVMSELADRLDTIEGLRVFPYTANKVAPPAASVGLPDEYTYDAAYGRGADALTVPIVVVVGKLDARSSHLQLSRYADGSGERSVKAAVEAGETDAFDSARVTSVDFAVITIAAVDYLGATFTVDITGKGA